MQQEGAAQRQVERRVRERQRRRDERDHGDHLVAVLSPVTRVRRKLPLYKHKPRDSRRYTQKALTSLHRNYR